MRKITPAAAVAAAAAAAAFLTGPAAAAGASHGNGCTAYSAGHSWYVQCQNGGGPGGGGSTGGSQRCFWTTNIDHYFPGFVQANPPPKGFIYIYGPVCPGYKASGPRAAFIYVVRNGGHLTPQDLARQAYARLRPPVPAPQTAPPRGRDGLVGLPQWFWVPAAQWAPQTVRLAAGPVWAVVTATPHRLAFSPGAGMQAVACPGPGTAYITSLPAAGQRSACTYTYTAPSATVPGAAYHATVTITWAATWQGSGGTGGTLPAITRSAAFPLRVAEGQALVTGGGG